MNKIAGFLTGIIAALHLYFLFLEMFLWQTETGMKVFGMTPEIASHTATLAKNQGLYNGFLAAGLIWSYFISNASFQKSVRTFFLTCIVVAGIFGALTAKVSILYIQALPALLALISVRFSDD